MANKKSVGSAGPGEVKAAWFMPEQMVRVPIGELVPYARNARTHSESQIAQIRASLREFFGLASAAPRSPYRHLELCGNSLIIISKHEMFTSLPADISCILMKKEDVSHEKYPCNGRL